MIAPASTVVKVSARVGSAGSRSLLHRVVVHDKAGSVNGVIGARCESLCTLVV